MARFLTKRFRRGRNILNNDEALAALALNRVKNVPIVRLRAVARDMGSFAAVLKADFEQLVYLGFDIRAAEALQSADLDGAGAELAKAEKEGIRVIPFFSEDYPELLREIADPPFCLYAKGNTASLHEICIAMVGARKATNNGEDMAVKLGRELAEHGYTVVSGLAYGIDICAHKGALMGEGATVAVLGSGLMNIYPAKHARYIDKICEKGCLLSELPLAEGPAAFNFPKRNRIISGMSRGVVVVEASFASGSLITCRLALEQDRDVFAVPCSPLSMNSVTNTLIRNGAVMTESWLDIAEQYAHIKPLPEEGQKSARRPDGGDRLAVYEALEKGEAGVDSLVNATGMEYMKLAAALAALELESYIEKGNDGRYRILY
jgi:DNA processing protein